jgi:hypothetical protein
MNTFRVDAAANIYAEWESAVPARYTARNNLQ